jgi:hypothetical protein
MVSIILLRFATPLSLALELIRLGSQQELFRVPCEILTEVYID